MEITRELFDQQRRPRFGTANPERMRLAFWEWMIRGDENPPAEQEGVAGESGLVVREGKLKSRYGPWRARDHFNVPLDREEGPIWTFDRMGATHTELPDGRLVCVGGEHEDWYDPDFHIYNDVVVLGPDDRVEIYGYPKDVFPPTDFHTATFVGDRLLLIGCLGYPEDRTPGLTPVYALSLAGYRIEKVLTSGEMPGWLSEHEAEFDQDRQVIAVRGGRVLEGKGGEQQFRRNVEDYELDLRTWVWRRLTHRNWCQFTIRQEDSGLFVLEQDVQPEALLPHDIEYTVLPPEDVLCCRIIVRGVPVTFTVEATEIRMTVEGELHEDLTRRIAEEARSNAEAAIQRPCVLESM